MGHRGKGAPERAANGVLCLSPLSKYSQGVRGQNAPGLAGKNSEMKHFLDIHKTDATELRAMIDSAHAMKSARNGRPRGAPDDDTPLKGRMVALIFEKPSTRTRVSWVMARRLPIQHACCRAMST